MGIMDVLTSGGAGTDLRLIGRKILSTVAAFLGERTQSGTSHGAIALRG